jgi:hypothetical protein
MLSGPDGPDGAVAGLPAATRGVGGGGLSIILCPSSNTVQNPTGAREKREIDPHMALGRGGGSEPRCVRFVHRCREINAYCGDGEAGAVKTVVDFATEEQCETLAAHRDIYGLQCCSTHGWVRARAV